jgi:phosphocarrier protein FPr
MANLTAAKSVEAAIEHGCEGVGLFRSEFIYMDYPCEPTVEQQKAEYAKVLDRLGTDRPLIVRTLDVGGDKPLTYMPMAEEGNPFLGIRGIRLSLRYPATLKNQLDALLLAANGRPLRIMFPMVTDITEWRKIKEIYKEVVADFPAARVELGIMIEVPSAALMAEVFAKEVDFFSVGTNDLTQYTLAIDRGHPELSRQADSVSPAVLNLINMTVQAADRNGIWVGVCGELASDPLGAAILTGLGVKELSMSVRAIPRIKAHLRKLSLTDAKILASKALVAESSEAVRQLTMEER